MKNLIIGILSAMAGAGVTYFLTKRHYEKQIDTLTSKVSKDMADMQDRLDRVHEEFVEKQTTEVASNRQKIWDDICKNPTANSSVGMSDEEAAANMRAGQVQAEYNNIINTYTPPARTVPDAIKEITRNEMISDERDLVRLSFFKSSGDLFDGQNRRIDEPAHLIGINGVELTSRIANLDDGETTLYFRNDTLVEDYEISIFEPDVPDPIEASLM